LEIINNFLEKRKFSILRRNSISSTSLIDFSNNLNNKGTLVKFCSNTNLIIIPEAKEKTNKNQSDKSINVKDYSEGNKNDNNNINKNSTTKQAKSSSRKSTDKLCIKNHTESLNFIDNNSNNTNITSVTNKNCQHSFAYVKKINSSGVHSNNDSSLKKKIISLFKVNEKEAENQKINKQMTYFRSIFLTIILIHTIIKKSFLYFFKISLIFQSIH